MSANKRPLFKKGDRYIVAIVAALCGVWLLCTVFLHPQVENGTAEITVNGEKYGSFSLQETRELHIEAADGGYNTVRIENGAVSVTHADCPDGLCVRQGKINRQGQSVVCLPHGLVITVKGGAENDVDF